MAELRKEWTCSECEVRCFKATKEPFPRPDGWVGDRCLSCSRLVETPIESARRQVLEGKSNSRIMVKGITAATLNQMRVEAIEAGDLKPDAGKPGKSAEPDESAVAAVEEALREDPTQANGAVAKRLGVKSALVKEARDRLGLRPAQELAKEREYEEMRPVLADNPDVSNGEMGKRLGCSGQRVKKVRERLGLPQPVVKKGPQPGWKLRSNVGSNR